jgi:3-oxoacyl-[acyl-carrier protein] reductase
VNAEGFGDGGGPRPAIAEQDRSSSPRGVALVTGAGRGLGRAIAQALGERGMRVAAVDRDESLLDWTRDPDRRGRFLAIPGDVRRATSVEEVVARVDAELGGLDVLVNNAGVLTVTRSEELDDDVWEPIVQTNLGGTIRLCKGCYPLLRRSGSASIVNISSITAALGLPGRLAYAASKAAIESVTRTLAVEWGPVGIRVNAIAPGFIATEGARAFQDRGEADPSLRSSLTPLRRPGTPREIADAVTWLAVDASFMNGQTVIVDGGFAVSAEAVTSPMPARVSR